ncbi:hypothetical protein CH063_00986 [Colletotrichum higginsianum]|uniref:Uncharacterized protein n=1 Tax=Colletotrichum higginsianum (strain IMI 349063) TaxID=759273 RepID=H1UZW1_COLHI|nr:uncharacterized protein CH63R_10671 [Colletotrichum higginsianum IMI 349063]OBR06551.1 hypothetical protein CH63R_10671 [Colletotrichum higginsianum IMI 349063]CCF33512.1 hypothetical protein CH063_00986 [Colletotrichum higginsianum]
MSFAKGSIAKNRCKWHYNTIVNCDYDLNSDSIGGYSRGQVPPEPDIAGIGIVAVFIAVTSFAVLMGVFDALWILLKKCRSRRSKDRSRKRKQLWNNFSRSEFFQAITISCSDQQVFTGGAYVVTLQFWKGCFITAYHYNIIANMLLLTCATHLMSVVISRNYWKSPLVAIVRVILITSVFILTGFVLSSQKSNFPMKVPEDGDPDVALLLRAACYQDERGMEMLRNKLVDSFKDPEAAKQAFVFSNPGNFIHGWNLYLAILVWYAVTILAEFGRWFYRARERRKQKKLQVMETRGKLLRGLEDRTSFLGKIFYWIYGFYVMGGLVICGITVVVCAIQIMKLRKWAKRSTWLKVDTGGQSEEDDATSFGQLVPIILVGLVVFSALATFSDLRLQGKRNKAQEVKPTKGHYGPIPGR